MAIDTGNDSKLPKIYIVCSKEGFDLCETRSTRNVRCRRLHRILVKTSKNVVMIEIHPVDRVGGGTRGMTKKFDPLATIGARYKALIKQRNVALSDLDSFLLAKFPTDKIKVSTFLREGTNASPSVRKALISFASNKLDLSLTEAWFDAEWHPSAPIEHFIEKNIAYQSIVREACGKYAIISPVVAGMQGLDREWRATPLIIKDQGQYFCFEMGQQNTGRTHVDHFQGFIVSHSDTIYLTGFDTKRHEKVIFLILRKAPQELYANHVRFCGLVAGSLPSGNMPNGRAIAKRVALVPDVAWNGWGDGKSMPPSVCDWLVDDASSISVELVPDRSEGSWLL